MKCICTNGCGLMLGGRDHVIEVDGQRMHFEMHPWSGPAALDARGEIAAKQPGVRHKFWTAVTLWGEQGRQVDADGLCIWAEPAKPELVHLGGRNYAEKGSALAKRFGQTTDIQADAGQLPARTTQGNP